MPSNPWTAAVVERLYRGRTDLPPVTVWAGQEPIGPVVLVLPWPPTGNHRLIPSRDGKRLVKAPWVRAYEQQAMQAIGHQHRGYTPLTGWLTGLFELHHPSNGGIDADNWAKSILDCCTEMQVYQDDKQFDYLGFKRLRNCERAYIRLTIERLG